MLNQSNLVDYKDFYKDFYSLDLNQVSKERIEELKELITKVNNRKTLTTSDYNFGSRNHFALMNHLKSNLKLYQLNSKTEMYILFMLCIDPELDVLNMVLDKREIKVAKPKIEAKFGIFDSNLLKLELEFAKKFLSDENTKSRRI